MFRRNVYLRTGLVMPRTGWVLDLGANRGLLSVWAALAGAEAIAVEAQEGFEPETRTRSLARSILKELAFPAKPAALFLYMYIARLGILDGMTGLRFCFYHA